MKLNMKVKYEQKMTYSKSQGIIQIDTLGLLPVWATCQLNQNHSAQTSVPVFHPQALVHWIYSLYLHDHITKYKICMWCSSENIVLLCHSFHHTCYLLHEGRLTPFCLMKWMEFMYVGGLVAQFSLHTILLIQKRLYACINVFYRTLVIKVLNNNRNPKRDLQLNTCGTAN